MTRRWLLLPSQGTLLVSTDLHGNLEDLERLAALFTEALERDPETHWAILGDAVHGPSESWRTRLPELYGYADESGAVVRRILEFRRRYPARVHYVLGNHDYGHIGGPHTAKFYDDEVAQLEATLDADDRTALLNLFGPALLAVVAPCGVLLAHGAPGDSLVRLGQLDNLALPAMGAAAHLVDSLLNSYGQPREVMERVLGRLSVELDFPITLAVHGHDRDESGLYVEGGNQVCPVLFGAPRHSKRYLVLDLSARYCAAADLVEGREIQRLYGARPDKVLPPFA